MYVVRCLETEYKRLNNTNKLNEIISFLKNVDIPKGNLLLCTSSYIVHLHYLDNEELITLCNTLHQYMTDVLLIAQHTNSSLQNSQLY